MRLPLLPTTELRSPPVSLALGERDQGHFVAFDLRCLRMSFVALKRSASLFPGFPNLRQESAAVTPGEHQLGIVGLLAANYVGHDGVVQVSLCAPHLEYVDAGLVRDGVQQRLELVDSGRKRLVPDDKLERNFDGKRGVV